MKQMKHAALVAVLATALAVPSALAARSTTGTLVATDGPGFTITLTQAGKKVKSLTAGTYTIKLQDKSKLHNFHLSGPRSTRRRRSPLSATSPGRSRSRRGSTSSSAILMRRS
jgi:hypothetical protein